MHCVYVGARLEVRCCRNKIDEDSLPACMSTDESLFAPKCLVTLRQLQLHAHSSALSMHVWRSALRLAYSVGDGRVNSCFVVQRGGAVYFGGGGNSSFALAGGGVHDNSVLTAVDGSSGGTYTLHPQALASFMSLLPDAIWGNPELRTSDVIQGCFTSCIFSVSLCALLVVWSQVGCQALLEVKIRNVCEDLTVKHWYFNT